MRSILYPYSCRLGSISLAVLALLPMNTSTIFAEENESTIEEVIVIAQRRVQTLQEVPISLSALTDSLLTEQGIDGFEDIAFRVPGFQLHGQSLAENEITLRGISPIGGSTAPVAVYIDEMPISGIQGNGQPAIKSFDVERIEILRGPQGTLYGEGSLGGTIRVIMKKPDTSRFAATLDSTLSSTKDGGTNTAANIMLNLPIIEDTLAARVIFQSRNKDGFIDAPNLGKEDVNSEQLSGGRISLRWLASDKLTVDTTAIYQDITLDGRSTGFSEDVTIVNPSISIPGSYIKRDSSISVDQNGTDKYGQYNVTVAYEDGKYQFTSATSYYDRDTQIARDLAGIIPAAGGVTLAGAGFGGYNPFLTADALLSGVGNLRTSGEQIFTQEFRIAYDDSEIYNWQVGIFYKDRKNSVSDFGFTTPDISSLVRSDVDLGAGGFFGSYAQNSDSLVAIEEQALKQTAVFGEISYNFSDKLAGTLGLRYFDESRDSTSTSGGYFIQATVFGTVMGMTGNPFAAMGAVNGLGLPITSENNADVQKTLWKANLSYKLSKDHLVYGTISTGFRSGGINTFALADEGLTGMPIGSLPRSYDPDTLINYELGTKTSWNNRSLIVNSAIFFMDWSDVQVNWDPTGLGFPTTINAKNATSKGIEIEAIAQLAEPLQVNFSAAFTDAKLVDDVFFPDGSVAFNDGGKLSGIPDYTYNLGAAYSFDISDNLEGALRANYSYTADSYRSPAEIKSEIADGYGLAYLSLTARSVDGWQVKLFINNLTDEAAQIFSESRGEYSTIRPRTIGVNASMEF